jgi:hypothetical protein
MIIGILLHKLSTTPYYSPTFGRGGMGAVFGCEVFQVGGTAPTLDIAIEHKNTEDVNFATLGSFTQFVAAGVDTKNLTGIKEQVRFKYTVGGSDGDAVHFNMLAPAWRPY